MTSIVKIYGILLLFVGCSLPNASSPTPRPKDGDFILVSPDSNYQSSKVVVFDPLTKKTEILLGGESGDVLLKILGDRLYLFNRQKGRSSFSHLSRNPEGKFERSVEVQTPMTNHSDPVDVLRTNKGEMILAMWTEQDVVRFDESVPSAAFGLASNQLSKPNERNQRLGLRPAFFLNALDSSTSLGIVDAQETLHVVHQNIDEQWKTQGDAAILSLSKDKSSWREVPISNPVSAIRSNEEYLLGGVCYPSMGPNCRSGLYRFSELNLQSGSLVEFDPNEWEPYGDIFEGFDESHVFSCGRVSNSENPGQSHLLKISTSTGRLLDRVPLPSKLCGGSSYQLTSSGEKVLYLGMTIPGKGGQFLIFGDSLDLLDEIDLDYSVGSFVLFN